MHLLKKIIYLFCFLFATESFAKKEALIVGVADYKETNSDLPGIDIDVKNMNTLLKSLGFKVRVLINDQSMELEKYLQMYSHSLDNKDTFVFYFSGHGSYIVDQNGDERDGQDETIVLSDGKNDYHYLDDELNYRLNQIKAKKMILFDSCHSGTANRGESNLKAKTIPAGNVLLYNKATDINAQKKEGEFIVFSASKDKEQSRASQSGSLFTSELYTILSSKEGKVKTFSTLQNETTINIVNRCKRSKVNPHHPNLSASDDRLKQMSILNYLEIEKKLEPEIIEIKKRDLQSELNFLFDDDTLPKLTLLNMQKKYRVGEKVSFSFDTNGLEGYLTILYVEKDDITILYPNPKSVSEAIGGKYTFPKDFGNFHLETYKNCIDCKGEQTTIYILLTSKQLENIEEKTRKKILSFRKNSTTSEIVSKAVKIVTKDEKKEFGYQVAIGKYEFVVY